jgi:acyl-lipid omega-6 desaturase (Delta-12 desaturase)
LKTAIENQSAAELRQLVLSLHDHCRSYTTANNGRAAFQLLSTLTLFLAVTALMYWLSPLENPAAMLLAIPAGGLLTRIFALQHDCGHGSFFTSKQANEWVGQFISVLTFTPYDHWRRSHAAHHAGSGNLERRGIGDIETLTVTEYRALSTFAKQLYRIKRHPLIALLIGPPIFFLVLQRGAFGSNLNRRESLPGIMWHNLALVVSYSTLWWALGASSVLAVVLPTALVASWIGGWLFFVQHQFEETMWEGADTWDVKTAALLGSSHLQLPAVLNWFTCDIGLHHIHHLSSRIPNYRLRACMAANKALQDIAPKLSFWKALTSVHLGLWDETERRLLSFGEYNQKFAA